jgi:hypothetical protein
MDFHTVYHSVIAIFTLVYFLSSTESRFSDDTMSGMFLSMAV